MKKIIALVPARMQSTRFPGKPLVDLCGKTMIEHVWQRIRLNKKIAEVYIATCDIEIQQAAEKIGAKAIMTSDRHQRGTDRIAEGCTKLLASGEDFDIAINVQGDEPLLNPQSLDLALQPFFDDNRITCVNLAEVIKTEDDLYDKNNVKVAFDANQFALYYSRLPIPTGIQHRHYKQLGVYAMTKQAVLQFPQLPQGPLEIAESDDMFRFVENGIPVKMVLTPYQTIGVDTPADREKVCLLMKQDPYFLKYRN